MIKKDLNILIADDNIQDQFDFQTAISEIEPNIRMNFVYNGWQLMDYLNLENAELAKNIQRPDIIISAMQMPFFTGVEVLKKIHAGKVLNDIPFYLFSNKVSEELRTEVLQNGGNDCYLKPSTFKALKGILNTIISEN